MELSSYGDSTKPENTARLASDISIDLSGRSVLLVDDIIDSGRTLEYAVQHLQQYQPRAIKTCVLLDKPARRIIPYPVNYTGFQIPNQFVVGYGLDHAARYRELPYIATI